MEIDVGFEPVGCKGMTKKMNSSGLFDVSASLCLCERVLERGGAEVASSIARGEEKVARLLAAKVSPKLFEKARTMRVESMSVDRSPTISLTRRPVE